MSSSIADLPFDDRPRERMMRHGCRSLSDAELIAILIGSGRRGRNAIEVAREILREGLPSLATCDWNSFATVPGIGPAKAARINAALEVGRRAMVGNRPLREKVPETKELGRRLCAQYGHLMQERLGAIYLDTRRQIMCEHEIFVGSLSASIAFGRDILRIALLDCAASVVVYHNHPSGNAQPSFTDLHFTKTLAKAAAMMDVVLDDHIVIGANTWYSMRKHNLIPEVKELTDAG